ncbi:NUDIX domain-containing protein [Lacisediminihabitans sp.]|uniref:NUDIX domain-containing protein n=1 Tax=Lacisediminihabitans sp. TaxID=2787631 RepID=UPI00374CCDA4
MRSCGLLLYRRTEAGVLEVFIGHMGGPFWAKKDLAAWSIPKGIADDGEHDLDTALREFEEETGRPAPQAEWRPLGEFAQPSRKVLVVFAGESDFDAEHIASNLFELEWPPRSGRIQRFPEIDRARWVPIDEARELVVKGQVAPLDALAALLAG